MKPGRKLIIAVVLIVICLFIKWFSSNSNRVELLYSTQFFPFFSIWLRQLFGKLPFSIGDILYAVVGAWVVYKSIKVIKFFYQKNQPPLLKTKIYNNLYSIFLICAVVYIIFNLFWGINYNRIGIAKQLGLPELKYGKSDLQTINTLLVKKVNDSKRLLITQNNHPLKNEELFIAAGEAYRHLGEKYQFMQYQTPSIKSSFWGWLGNYVGFLGYYNPFTGEGQVNTTIPKFIQPFTACHEVAHQIGYAKEMEANFVGYLAATSSTDTLFHYSVYLDLFMYANRNLFMLDSSAAKKYRKELIQPVKADIKEWILFNQKHRGALEPIVRWGYGIFLQSNEQPQGMLSYDEVTSLLIAYYHKFGKI